MEKTIDRRKPQWLKTKLPSGEQSVQVKKIIRAHGLHTICTSGKCPNQAECWGNGTATFMILGDICTRSCKFCATKTGKPLSVDESEPYRIAESVKLLKLKHVVITSVDRDDLDDGGAAIWADTIRKVKEINPETTMEVLIPDFNGNLDLLDMIIKESPEVMSHNLETVERLTPQIRSKAKYRVSLDVIRHISNAAVTSKSGIMVGLGEKNSEVYQTMDDLLDSGCQVMTIGQYLQPSKNNLPVEKYITPDEFNKYKETGLKKGFKAVESGPMVRSSYHAEKHVIK